LLEVSEILEADTVVGIGKYAEKRAKKIAKKQANESSASVNN
jgi:hypothetical protein